MTAVLYLYQRSRWLDKLYPQKLWDRLIDLWRGFGLSLSIMMLCVSCKGWHNVDPQCRVYLAKQGEECKPFHHLNWREPATCECDTEYNK